LTWRSKIESRFEVMPKSRRYSAAVNLAVVRAQHLAVARQSACVETAHLFLGLLQVESEEQSLVTTLLEISGVTIEEAKLYALSAIQTDGKLKRGEPPISRTAQRTLALALEEADKLGSATVRNEHLLIACLHHQRGQHVGEVLRPLGLDAATLRAHLHNLTASGKPASSGSPLLFLTEDAKAAVEAAHASMRNSFCGRISTAHLLLGVLADEKNVAVETLQTCNVDIAALMQATRSAITSDGEIAGPQKKFSPAAKRTLERAKKEADRCQKSLIGPQHLLYALLPRPASVPERVAFGADIDDPLERIWLQWPVDDIERRYVEMWRQGKPQLPVAEPPSSVPDSWIKLNWYWVVAGVLWWAWAWLFELVGALPLVVALAFAIFVAIGAAITKNKPLRDVAASFCFGMFVGPFATFFVWVIFRI
jgi:hypothetical protein